MLECYSLSKDFNGRNTFSIQNVLKNKRKTQLKGRSNKQLNWQSKGTAHANNDYNMQMEASNPWTQVSCCWISLSESLLAAKVLSAAKRQMHHVFIELQQN